MNEVNFFSNTLNDESTAILSTCLHNIKKLNVAECQLTVRGIENLCNGINQLTVPVRKRLLLGNC